MRHIHPAAWGGLLLNASLVYILLKAIGDLLGGSQVSSQEEQILQALQDIKPLLFSLLIGQAAGLGLISLHPRLGLGLALVSGLFMLPASLIFMTGSLLSYYNTLYSAFPLAGPKQAKEEGQFFTSRYKLYTYVLCASIAFITFAFYLAGNGNLSLLAAAAALACSYATIRINANPALGVHQQHISLTPAPMAPRLRIDYSSIVKAVLLEKGIVEFVLRTQEGERLLRWNFTLVAPAQQRAAFDALGKVLQEQDIPLE